LDQSEAEAEDSPATSAVLPSYESDILACIRLIKLKFQEYEISYCWGCSHL
jgi:hypothetical protein